MVCHPKNAEYVKRWRAKHREQFAKQHREHSRVYYLKQRDPWMRISLEFLGRFKYYV